ncbi:sensor histidine kinase [Kytococcus sedentarius]|uniref:sensor histidine kinase n=1 Tax=Kytococcus sedentarius TaxID=1276 RepID=UPI0035BBD343
MSARQGLGERLATLWGPEPAQRAPLPRLTTWDQVARLAAVVVVGAVLFAFNYGTLSGIEDQELLEQLRDLRTLELVLGALSLPLLLWRRRRPVTVSVLTGAMMPFSAFAMAAHLLALVSLASRRRVAPIVATVMLLLPASWVVQTAIDRWVVNQELGAAPVDFLANQLLVLMVGAVFVLLGWNIGARRELAWVAQQEAAAAEREQTARVAQARLAERTAIAREMHDALGHRLSVVSMHAGALAYRQDLEAEQVREAAGTIAGQARQALEDLREILGVLRSNDADGAPSEGSPQVPDLRRLGTMVQEASGMGCTIDLEVPERLWEQILESLPGSTSRHAYRVAQESVTNACKHAPGQPLRIEIGGAPGRGVTLRVENPLPPVEEVPSDVVSGGMGLTGMAERVALAGGQLEAGPQDGSFVVEAWLPWERRRVPAPAAPQGAAATAQFDGSVAP